MPPFSVFNSILEFADVGDTKYDSLQIKGETKSRRYGLYALISYTYAHAYDNGLSDGLGSLLSAFYFPLPVGRSWIGLRHRSVSTITSRAA